MKTRANIICLFMLISFSVLPTVGQTNVFKINVISPPSSLPTCKTRLKTVTSNGRSTTIFSVLVARELELDLDGSVNYQTEGDYYIFPFEADSGICQTTSSGYEIRLSGSGQANPTLIAPQPVAIATPTPISTPNPRLVPSEAEDKEATDEAKEVDLSIPESPGFAILGLNPQEVTRPATPREFATAIINSFDRNGNFQTGIAIDTSPFQLFFGNRVGRDDYIAPQENKKIKDRKRETAKGYLTRFLWRTQFSLATTKGTTENDKSARIGTGLNFTFFDFGDPSTDFFLKECNLNLNDELEKLAYETMGLSGPDDDRITPAIVRQIPEQMRILVSQGFIKKYEKCVKDSEKRNFGKSSFGVGVAGSWISEDGRSSKFTNNGQAIWASLAYGFDGFRPFRCSEAEVTVESNRCITPQLIFHFRRRVKETVPNPLVEGAFTTKDSNLFGTRLRIGVPKWSFNLEGVYRGSRYAGRTSSNSIETSLGADYKLADNLYLNFSIGGATKESNIPNTGKVFVRTSFNWGTSQKPLGN